MAVLFDDTPKVARRKRPAGTQIDHLTGTLVLFLLLVQVIEGGDMTLG